MRDLTPLELAEAQAMTDSVARSMKTRKPKTEADGATEAGLNFSGVVNFSDNRPDDKADFLAPERAETALFDIKRLVARSGVQESIKKFLTQRNESIRKTKEKQKEKEAQKKAGYVSHPNIS